MDLLLSEKWGESFPVCIVVSPSVMKPTELFKAVLEAQCADGLSLGW